ncbi:MAG: carbohydrate kinase [Gammaproteobacteria bacterium]|nr:carbohydrate kinase [Gammaproteobacteria bacterium]
MYFLGLDIGSSSVKLAILDGESGCCIGQTQQPEGEFSIVAAKTGYAEQSPDIWWQAVVNGIKQLLASHPEAKSKITAIGISYQMHGLVAIDSNHQVLHPAIIWCDSRATQSGDKITAKVGENWCLQHLLNTPGNFTLAKLKWLADNKPEVYGAIHKILLPGDYIALRLSGEATTTSSGLSEAILWDFQTRQPAWEVLDKIGIERSLIADLVPNFGEAGVLSRSAANELGLNAGIKLTYRAGDQPNNAFSLNVLEDGEFATTAGTSGVVYAVTDKLIADTKQRINSFLHVNNHRTQTLGVMACINGAGRLNSWLRQLLSTAGKEVSYQQLNDLAEQSPPGSQGLTIHPFGNGAERILNNKLLQAHFSGIDFNRHEISHVVRAAQEGVAFAMALGMTLIKDLGVSSQVIRAGKANMFLSDVFAGTFVNTTQTPLEFYETNGAEGAARGAAWAAGFYSSREDTFKHLKKIQTLEPQTSLASTYTDVYCQWQQQLTHLSDPI